MFIVETRSANKSSLQYHYYQTLKGHFVVHVEDRQRQQERSDPRSSSLLMRRKQVQSAWANKIRVFVKRLEASFFQMT